MKPRPAEPARFPVRLPIAAQYGLALVAVAISIGLRSAAAPLVGDHIPLALTTVALASVVWAIDTAPFIVGSLIGLVAASYFFLSPHYNLVAFGPATVQIGVFALMTVVLGAAVRVSRRHARQAVAASRALIERDAVLRTVAHGSTMLLAYVDADLRYRFVNEAYCGYFNVSGDEVVGRTVPEHIGAEAYQRIRPHLDLVFAGRSAAFEADLPYLTLGVRRMRIAYAPDLRPDGSVAGYTAAMNDVTEERRAAEALRSGEERFRLATEALQGVVYDRDHATGIVTRSAGLAALIGIPAEAAPRTAAWWAGLIHPDDRARFEEALRTAAHRREPGSEAEYRVRHDDGRWVWVWDHARHVYGCDGRLARTVGSIVSIDDRKRAEEALRESRDVLSLAMRGGRMGAWSRDLSTPAMWWSRELEEIFGLPPGGFEGTEAGFFSLIHEEDRPAVVAAVDAGIADRDDYAVEFRFRHADGSWRWMEGRGRAVYDAAGRPTVLYGIGIDITERRAAESALRESESRLRLALQASGAGVWTADLATGAAFWTDEFFTIYGYAPSTPRTLETWLASVHPDDREAVQADIADCLAARAAEFRKEFRIVHPQRGVRWILDIGRVEYAADGRPLRAGGTNIDITDRKRTEQQLLRNHETFFNLIENAPFGVYVVDADFRLRQVSAGSQKVFANVRPLLGRDFADILRFVWPEPFASEAIARFRHTLATGEPYAAPDTTERRNDIAQTESYDWKIERITLPDGQHGVVCYFYDMTERRRAEAALLDSERRLQAAYAEFRSIYEQSPVGMAQFDRDLRFVRVNDALAAMNGVPAAAHIGRTLREVVPDLAPKVEDGFLRILRDGRPVVDVEIAGATAADPGAEHVWLESWFPIRDPQGNVTGLNVVAQDITDRKRAEAELARYREHLEHLVRERTAELEKSQAALRLSERMAALGTFAAGLGHDITNTLLPLRVRVEEVLAEPGLEQRTRAEILAIVGFLKYLQSLARGLRLFAQDPDRPAGREDRTDLTAWWDDTAAFFRASVPASIRLACDIPRGLPNVAVAPHRLSQAVLNLVHNARDAVTAARGPGAGGRIAIAARADADGRAILLSVTDDGAGMSDETRRRCIEPFYSTKTRGMGGTGLGLSMVHGIASSAGGDLLIDSAPGSGATVTLRLPAARTPDAADTAGRRTTFITLSDKRIAAFATALAGALGRRAVAAPPPPGGCRPGDSWITDAAAAPHDLAHAFVERSGPSQLIILGDLDGWPAPPPPGAVLIPGRAPIGRLREALTAAVSPEPARAAPVP